MVPEEMPLSLVSKSGYILYPVIFSGSQRLQQGKPKEKKSVLSQHDKEKQIALKHESSALSYSPLLFSNKKRGGSIFLDPRTTNQLPFFLLGAQKLGSGEASAPLRLSSHPTFVIMSLTLLYRSNPFTSPLDIFQSSSSSDCNIADNLSVHTHMFKLYIVTAHQRAGFAH